MPRAQEAAIKVKQLMNEEKSMFQTASLQSECTKAAQIISHFVLPEFQGHESMIPSDILSKAKGLAILQVVRAGFHISGRFGSGVVVAKLPNGTWSPPSVVKTAGVGIGAMIGAEITDCVMVLNTDDAVAAFHKGENVTLGGNMSVAAGPIGRSAEASSTIVGKAAPIFSYSKTKGLYAGMSFEGSTVTEGKEANVAFYGRPITAKEILSGAVPRPQAAAALYQILEARAVSTSRPPSAAGTNPSSSAAAAFTAGNGKTDIRNDVIYAAPPTPPKNGNVPPALPARPDTAPTLQTTSAPLSAMPSEPPAYSYAVGMDPIANSDTKGQSSYNAPIAGGRPLPTPPPASSSAGVDLTTTYCVALYDYTSAEPGDLQFKAGDTIRVSKKNADGWWVGSVEKKEGTFPSTYVRQL
ncbi:SH3 domain-containing protein [Obelidium mucronatum]|nr:SH3 domain-containing protein [Obelidium mucronatum]